VLEDLSPDEVGPVVETRTGFHIFRLLGRTEPTPPTTGELRAMAARDLLRERLEASRSALIFELREELDPQTSEPPWQVGSWQLDEETVAALSEQVTGDTIEARRSALVDLLLLAEAGRRRSLEDADLEQRLERSLHQFQVGRCLQQRRAEILSGIEESRLRLMYEEAPESFAEPPRATVDLVFVPEGDDPFTTEQELRQEVARLRDGASFADWARAVSVGPKAEEGGELGELATIELAMLHPYILRAVAPMEEGSISDPVHCPELPLSRNRPQLVDGFAVLRLRGRTEPAPRTFEEAVDTVRRAWAAVHAEEMEKELRATILDEASFRVVRLPDLEEVKQAPEDENPPG
jgi:parvulin-like peptidyl-prolyl isomerase